MGIDTPTGLKKPGNDTDPWIVGTLREVKKSVEFNTERIGYIKDDTQSIKSWTNEHDVRHRKIDGRLAVVAIGIPIGTAIIILAVSTLLGG